MAKVDFSTEINFTETYKKYKNEHIAMREAMCLKEQFPSILTEIREEDLFAGRVKYGLVGFSPSLVALDIIAMNSQLLTLLEKGISILNKERK